MTQFLITALGSYGDVHPMVGLGAALAARGHQAKIVTNPYFEDVVGGAGLDLLPLGTREDYVRLSEHPDLWHPLRGPKLVLGYASAKMLRPLYDLLIENYIPGDTVFCAHAMDLASRTAGEHLKAPVASILFAPGMLWSLHDSPRLKGALLGPRVPRWIKRTQFWLSDLLFIRPLLGPDLNRLRRELGLPAVRRIFSQWLFKSDLPLCLFPDWFGPRQPDWPANAKTTGFPLWDAPGNTELPDKIRKFLNAGSPPIAFSPGSANKEAHHFFESAVAACQRLGRRGVLMTKYADQLPPDLPETIYHAGFVPMSKLLPRTAALVHHGGIGSCAQGLAAGVPQLVRPMAYDQFDNSRRIVRLGVGQEISVRQFTGQRVADALLSLLSVPDVASRCREYAGRCNGPAALTAACEALEQLAAQKSARTGVGTH
jgi:UDP:flavonoid glycosyltransferase YjiC (YdhE family)